MKYSKNLSEVPKDAKQHNLRSDGESYVEQVSCVVTKYYGAYGKFYLHLAKSSSLIFSGFLLSAESISTISKGIWL